MGFIFGMSITALQTRLTIAHRPLGGFNIMRYGAGPNGPMRTLGQYMLGSGATFGYKNLFHMMDLVCVESKTDEQSDFLCRLGA